MQFRGKNKPTNILSFEYSKTSGEIVIQLDCVKKDAPKFGLPYTKFLGFLFIHGLLHLKGISIWLRKLSLRPMPAQAWPRV